MLAGGAESVSTLGQTGAQDGWAHRFGPSTCSGNPMRVLTLRALLTYFVLVCTFAGAQEEPLSRQLNALGRTGFRLSQAQHGPSPERPDWSRSTHTHTAEATVRRVGVSVCPCTLQHP